MKQDDDVLRNYTVAKITMDCDFNPQWITVEVMKQNENNENVLDEDGNPIYEYKKDASGNVIYDYEYEAKTVTHDKCRVQDGACGLCI